MPGLGSDQYTTDANLAARQQLWQRSPRDGGGDLFAWMASQVVGDRVVEVGCNGSFDIHLRAGAFVCR